ncbi:MAG: translation elongation factor Ts [Bacteroidetes bacterium RIFCSPLOWO2_12_FULL_35_15]|nr:MAG: translation elongation factor Ts [Bacteroidetes bacterium RIFCSPLOWO2_12_FULL_35_15]
MTITAAEINKLRQMTGAGMMDCKKALTEANGDFEKAIDELRKKGQKVAANRGDRESKEGVVISKVTSDNKRGVVLAVNCETDFVAINAEFGKFVTNILEIAIEKNPRTADELKALPYDSKITIAEKLIEQTGVIGEKIELNKFEIVEAPFVIAYNHPGNRLANIVGFSSAIVNADVAKDVAMQVAAMAPVAVDKGDVDAETIKREIEVGKEQARAEGKPEEMLEKIAMGKLNKFYKESTLLNQEFIKDNKKTIAQYLNDSEKGLTVTSFKRIALS